ncbi:hypothetical protein AAE02nite_01560 [Adhaeribacter aerolatus]|uniref:Phospholipid/glycerol acyltransferase domain-containing protein n=1 Tax=Adhaeribacter aerolatus TaxID=670289 RepID=A0A512AS18_9BACT|nr:lysophospholipid acyltransferase family protein [Adhaeribacter aerolatus]GEO02492.1 hypothetical protein AAE02nite_01560 [Adhaeribacter aerolatus]
MFYAFLKVIFNVALRIFFRRVEVRNKKLIPAKGPLLLVANHPNTFMDPIAIAAIVKPEVFFLAKSTLFNNGLNKWLLRKMNLIPIYRREDNAAPIAAANDTTFRQCFEFLQQQGTLLIFPEGNSYSERRLRPLKTGTARIALGAEAQVNFKAGVQLLPIGLNYSDPTRFGSTLFINVGEPIRVADYAEIYNQDPFKAVQQLTAEVRSRLEALLVTFDSPAEDELTQRIRNIYAANLTEELGLSRRQQDRFVLTKGITDSIRYFSQQEPERVRKISEKIHLYYLNLKKLGLQDKFLHIPPDRAVFPPGTLLTALFLLLGFPVFVWGLLTNYIPYFIPGKIADLISEEEEFRAPIMMTAGIFTFSIFYALLIWAFYVWSNSSWVTLFLGISLPISGLFSFSYSFRLRLTRSYLKFLAFFFRQSILVETIWQQRQEIIRSLEDAKGIYLQHLDQRSETSSLEHFQ